jgi:hypothetical protein
MDWYWLGHAMWLAEVGELRILFDPLLERAHHGGVFEVWPARRVRAAAMRADFVVVSHRHPDHFDPSSLRALADADADTVVLTADELVASVARRVGLRTVQVIGAGCRVDLHSARVFTTPSATPDVVEWGAMIEAGGAVVWNQVDTALRGSADVRRVCALAAEALGAAAARPDLVLARWQPLLEVTGALGERTAFPLEAYTELLDQAAATQARALVPSSAGVRHARPYAAMNRAVYPVTEARWLRDVQRRMPSARALPALLGARYRVSSEGVELEPGVGADLVEVLQSDGDDRVYRPFELPPITDEDLGGRDVSAMRDIVGRWIERTLAPALLACYPATGARRPLRFVVEVVFSSARDAYTLEVSSHGARCARGLDADYDALNVIAGSMLFDVIEGRRHWGDPLLAGLYRASLRAYDVDEHGVRPLRVAATFLYHAISYEESILRALDWELGGGAG